MTERPRTRLREGIVRITALPFVLFASSAFAASFDLGALTDKMQAQVRRDEALAAAMTGRVLVPSASPYLGRRAADPARLPMPSYRSLGHVQFSDGFVAHTVHDVLDETGTQRIVVIAHGIARGETDRDWRVAADQEVSPPAGTMFVGADAGRTVCLINGSPMLTFGFLKPDKDGFRGTGNQMYALDPHSNLIPLLPEYQAECLQADD